MLVITRHTDTGVLSGKAEGMLVAGGILSSIPAMPSAGMVRVASSGDAGVLAAMKAFVAALEAMSASTSLSQDQLAALSKTARGDVAAESLNASVKVASAAVRDSNYFMDVGLDPIRKEGKSLVMVSYMLREGSLGRCMIKRCFFYLPGNVAEARATYDELVRKSEGVKRRLLQDEAKTFDVMPQVKAFLDGIRGDFEFRDEDSLGTTVKRDRESYHAAEGPPYIRLA